MIEVVDLDLFRVLFFLGSLAFEEPRSAGSFYIFARYPFRYIGFGTGAGSTYRLRRREKMLLERIVYTRRRGNVIGVVRALDLFQLYLIHLVLP